MGIILSSKGVEIQVSDEDLEALSKYTWKIDTSGYAYRSIRRGKGKCAKQQHMHKFLMPKREGYIIDHQNRQRLDNTRDNLRYLTYAENARNRTKFNGESKYKGVRATNSTFTATIVYNFKPIHIGTFPTEDLAGAAYDIWAMDLDPTYILNFPQEDKIHEDVMQYMDDTKRSKYNSKRGETGYRGVTYDSSKSKYVARVTFKNKRYKLGFSKNATECARFYDTAERMLYPNRRRLNFYTEEIDNPKTVEKVQRILDTVGSDNDEVIVNRSYTPEPTQYKGVSKHGDRYYARVYHNKTVTHLGYFDTAEDAAREYNARVEDIKGVNVILNVIPGD